MHTICYALNVMFNTLKHDHYLNNTFLEARWRQTDKRTHKQTDILRYRAAIADKNISDWELSMKHVHLSTWDKIQLGINIMKHTNAWCHSMGIVNSDSEVLTRSSYCQRGIEAKHAV